MPAWPALLDYWLGTPAPDDAGARMEAISFYQTASYLYEHDLYRALSAEEFRQYAEEGRTAALSAAVLAKRAAPGGAVAMTRASR